MIYSPSWLQVDAILAEYRAPTPPTYTPPAEAALSQAACVYVLDRSVGCALFSYCLWRGKSSGREKTISIKYRFLFCTRLAHTRVTRLRDATFCLRTCYAIQLKICVPATVPGGSSPCTQSPSRPGLQER